MNLAELVMSIVQNWLEPQRTYLGRHRDLGEEVLERPVFAILQGERLIASRVVESLQVRNVLLGDAVRQTPRASGERKRAESDRGGGKAHRSRRFTDRVQRFDATGRQACSICGDIRIRLWQPDDRQRHGFLNSPALTCSQRLTSEGFCSCRLIRQSSS